jgi:hypothetical protein
VHGTLDKKNIIVGIDDKSCNENTGMFKFSKTYRKMKIRSEINNELPANIDQLIFYGHSLGKQDYSYFHSIFDFYNIYNSSIKLLFCYAKGYENQTFDSIYHLIHEYGNEFTNQKQGHNLLHKILLEGRLQIIEIPSIDSIK